MHITNLGATEKAVLGALIIHSDEQRQVHVTFKKIAETIGYKDGGGTITYALRVLERDNYIVILGKSKYKLLI